MAQPDTPEQESNDAHDSSVEERLERALISKEAKSDDEEPEGDPAESEEAAEETPEQAEEELYELEHEGKKARVPKEFKDAFLRQDDYTKKTMSVAEEKRQLAEERQVFQLNAQIEGAIAEQMTDLRSLVSTSKQYEAAIQQAISNGDAGQIATLNAQYSMLQRQIEEKAGEVRTKKNEQAQLLQYEKQQRRVKADEEAGKRIPNFSIETKKELVASARSLGFQDYEIAEVDDPRVYQALWKAAQWDKLQSKSAEVKKQVAVAPKALSAKGSTPQSAKSANIKDMRDKLHRTGRADYAERLIEQRLLGKR